MNGPGECDRAGTRAPPDGTGSPSHLRDAVYGGIDGSVTTLAIVAGVAGAGLSNAVVLALGTASVLADGFSMAAGNFAGTRAERAERDHTRTVELERIGSDPEGERDGMRRILAAKGLSAGLLDGAVAALTADRERWVETMLVEAHGLGPVDPRPLRAALTTFAAFVACGLVPPVPFLLALQAPFGPSVAATMLVFVAIGAVKSRWTGETAWRAGGETLLIGGVAAGIAYGVGVLLGGLVE